MYKITSNATVPKALHPHVARRRKGRKFERFVKKLNLNDKFNVPLLYIAAEISKEMVKQEIPYRIVRRKQINGSFDLYIQPQIQRATQKTKTVKNNPAQSQVERQYIDSLVRSAMAGAEVPFDYNGQTPAQPAQLKQNEERLHAILTAQLKQNEERSSSINND